MADGRFLTMHLDGRLLGRAKGDDDGKESYEIR